jgi:hypothetical protein
VRIFQEQGTKMRHQIVRTFAAADAIACVLVLTATTTAQPIGPPRSGAELAAEAPNLPAPEGAKAMPEPDRVWIDAERHEVLVDGYIAMREGYLEMFACPVGTKEHESVVAVDTRAATVHAALLAVGAVEGRPVQYKPEFVPPSGTEIEIEVRWLGADGKWQSVRAQDMVREAKTKDVMTQPWVFAGSGFWTDEKTGKRYYMAESGDFICLSNFTTATLDVPIESTDSNEGLVFEANTEKIPEPGTLVRLVLRPVLEDEDKPGDAGAAAPQEGAIAE